MLNSQKTADLKPELALSADGVVTVQKVTDITPVKNADTSLTSPKIGAAVGILLPCAFLAAALWILLSFKRKSNKQNLINNQAFKMLNTRLHLWDFSVFVILFLFFGGFG